MHCETRMIREARMRRRRPEQQKKRSASTKRSARTRRFVYSFHDLDDAEATAGSWDGVKALLGGKGANLADMVRLGLPVPHGFVITTDACRAYSGSGAFPPALWKQTLAAVARLEKETGKRFGDPARPLLVACRSGA